MRILYVTGQPLGHVGADRYLQAMIQEAAARGHRLHLLQLVNAGQDVPVPWIAPSAISNIAFATSERSFAVPAVRRGLGYATSAFAELSEAQIDDYLEALETGLRRAVRQAQPQVVHVNRAWIAAAMARSVLHQHPIVVSAHYAELEQAAGHRALLRRVIPPLREVERVLAVSQEHARSVGELYGIRSDRLEVVGSGVDVSHFRPSSKSTSGEFGQVAERLSLSAPRQGLRIVSLGGSEAEQRVIQQAVSKLDPQPRVALLVVREAGTADQQATTSGEGGGCSVFTIDGVVRGVLADLLRGSHVCLLPRDAEGLPIALLRALACGCRVVMPDLEILRGWPDPDLIEPTSVERVATGQADDAYVDGLAAALERQLSRARAGRLRKTALDIASRLSWDSVFRRVEGIYGELSPG